MTSRLASVTLASLLLCTACPSDDGGETSTTVGEGESDTDGDTETETGTDSETDTETDTGPTCGVGTMTCCAELEECQTTEDCCDPATFTCTLEAASTKCVDLVQMCTDCVTNCEGQGVPPDVCASSCALWCDPP